MKEAIDRNREMSVKKKKKLRGTTVTETESSLSR